MHLDSPSSQERNAHAASHPHVVRGTASQDASDASDEFCPKCFASSKDQPIHCLLVTPSPHIHRDAAETTIPSRILSVPTLRLQTSEPPNGPVHPHRPSPIFQYHDGIHERRSHRNALSPVSSQNVHQFAHGRHIAAEFGTRNGPSKSAMSPVTPGTIEKAGDTNKPEIQGGSMSSQTNPSNIAQRIEQKLLAYSTSQSIVKRWLIEIISWTVSALCMTGIITVLCIYQGRPLPRWPLGLTINAYISVLAKVGSAALLFPVSGALGQLKWNWFQDKPDQSRSSRVIWDFELFDDASRGPWGSFMLLLRIKGRSLAALGAFITLFALAMDPFFQQLVGFPDHWRLQTVQGFIPRTSTYRTNNGGEAYTRGLHFLEPDQSIWSTAYRYFYDHGIVPVPLSDGSGIRASIPLTCPTGNCTWGTYETLAACNKCTDITEQLEFHCRHTTLDWVPDPIARADLYWWDYPNGTVCGWFLMADEPILMTGYNVDQFTNHTGELLVSRSQPLYDLNTRQALAGYSARLNDTRNPLAHVVIASGHDAIRVRRNATPVAHECIISWCIKTMTSTVVAEAYTELTTATTFNHTWGPDPWNITIVYGDGVPKGMNMDYAEDAVIIGDNGSIYRVDSTTHGGVVGIFDDIFPSTYTTTNTTNMSEAILRDQQYRTQSYRTREIDYNPFLYGNISIHLDNFASDLTNIARSEKTGIQMVPGEAYAIVRVVEVRWPWLSLPLGLLIFTLIFLVATIIRSSREDEIGVWKTSAVATLLHGLPDDVRNKVISTDDKEKSHARAKDTKVRWLPGTGWRLSGASAFSASSPNPRYSVPRRGER